MAKKGRGQASHLGATKHTPAAQAYTKTIRVVERGRHRHGNPEGENVVSRQARRQPGMHTRIKGSTGTDAKYANIYTGWGTNMQSNKWASIQTQPHRWPGAGKHDHTARHTRRWPDKHMQVQAGKQVQRHTHVDKCKYSGTGRGKGLVYKQSGTWAGKHQRAITNTQKHPRRGRTTAREHD